MLMIHFSTISGYSPVTFHISVRFHGLGRPRTCTKRFRCSCAVALPFWTRVAKPHGSGSNIRPFSEKRGQGFFGPGKLGIQPSKIRMQTDSRWFNIGFDPENLGLNWLNWVWMWITSSQQGLTQKFKRRFTGSSLWDGFMFLPIAVLLTQMKPRGFFDQVTWSKWVTAN